MKIKLYQINLDKDTHGVAFESFDRLEKLQGFGEVDTAIYDKTYEGCVEADDLEDVFRIFNIDHPAGYTGRSLSVSDVVEVEEAEHITPGFYFCDSIGFKKISWKEKEA